MYSKFYFFGLNHEPINNVENFHVYFNDTISWYRTDIRNIEASPDPPRVVCCRRRASLARQAYGDDSHLPELVWVPPPHSDWSTSVALSVVDVVWTKLNSSSEHVLSVGSVHSARTSVGELQCEQSHWNARVRKSSLVWFSSVHALWTRLGAG